MAQCQGCGWQRRVLRAVTPPATAQCHQQNLGRATQAGQPPPPPPGAHQEPPHHPPGVVRLFLVIHSAPLQYSPWQSSFTSQQLSTSQANTRYILFLFIKPLLAIVEAILRLGQKKAIIQSWRGMSVNRSAKETSSISEKLFLDPSTASCLTKPGSDRAQAHTHGSNCHLLLTQVLKFSFNALYSGNKS